MSLYDKLQQLGIQLPPVSTPAAAYVPFVQTGKLVFLSGHIARHEGKPWVGKLGHNITTEEGAQAARFAYGECQPAALYARHRRLQQWPADPEQVGQVHDVSRPGRRAAARRPPPRLPPSPGP